MHALPTSVKFIPLQSLGTNTECFILRTHPLAWTDCVHLPWIVTGRMYELCTHTCTVHLLYAYMCACMYSTHIQAVVLPIQAHTKKCLVLLHPPIRLVQLEQASEGCAVPKFKCCFWYILLLNKILIYSKKIPTVIVKLIQYPISCNFIFFPLRSYQDIQLKSKGLYKWLKDKKKSGL